MSQARGEDVQHNNSANQTAQELLLPGMLVPKTKRGYNFKIKGRKIATTS